MRIRRRTKRRIRKLILMSPLFVLIGFVYLIVRPPSSAPPMSFLRASGSPKEVERGRYLFTALVACDRCHSPLDYTRLHSPVIPGARGTGRTIDFRNLPGTVTAPNLTMDPETGLGKWSDAEIVRAIREGVSKDGRALYPLMPYSYFRRMTDEDALSIVAYLKSLAPTVSNLPRTNLTFVARVTIKSEPRPSGSVPPQDDLGGAIFGEYMVGIAACQSCHTPPSRWFFSNRPYAGGVFFETPYGQVYSSNITQDDQTGIGRWNFRQFEASMHQHRQYAGSEPPKISGERFTVMPWEAYADITDKDLESMFLYLRNAKPVNNSVQPHPGFARAPARSK